MLMERLSNLPRLIRRTASVIAPALLAWTLQSCGPGLAGKEPSAIAVPNYPTFQDNSNGLSVSAVARCGEQVTHGVGPNSWILKDPVDMKISVKGLPNTPMAVSVRANYPRIAPREVLVLHTDRGGQADVNLVDGYALDNSRAIGIEDGFNDVLVLQARRNSLGPRFQVIVYLATRLQTGQPVELDREVPLAQSQPFSLTCS